jgi:FtsZ-binding cell division protein ZapB
MTTENQSADAQPKYLKSKTRDLIVWQICKSGDVISAKIIECNEQSTVFKKGEIRHFSLDDFEPCDYTPNIEVVETVEQPKALNAKQSFNLYQDLMQKAYEQLEQENAQLKDENESISRMAANFERENKQLISDLQAVNKRITT